MVNKEHYEAIKEVNTCRGALLKNFDIYTVNAIERLILAHIKLERLDNQSSTKKENP